MVNTPNPNPRNVYCQDLFNKQATSTHHTCIPFSHLCQIHCDVYDVCQPNDEENDSAWAVPASSSLLIDCADCDSIAGDRKLHQIEKVFMQKRKSYSDSLTLDPSEYYEETEG